VPAISVGVQLSSFGLPFKQAIQVASALGADSIEIDARSDLRPTELTATALRQIRKLLNDLNLRVVAVRFQTSRGYDCADDLERRVAATKIAMKMASELGANAVVNQIGIVPESLEDSTHQMLRDVLSDLGRYAQHIGAFLACETGSEPLANLSGLIESLSEGSLAVTLNPGNLIVNGFDLTGLRKIAPHVLLVHAKDAVPDRARGRGTEVALGRGLVEFPELMATLEEQHFRGSYVVQRDTKINIREETAVAIQFLKNI